jgi:hypothetical protein
MMVEAAASGQGFPGPGTSIQIELPLNTEA